MVTACLAFAAMAALLTITPGVDTMLVLRGTVTGGRRTGLLASCGVVTGLVCWAMTSAVGLTALLAASRLAFDVLRVAGACYLLWLGGRALWNARRPSTTEVPEARFSGLTAFRTGLTTNVLNPKVGVFYMSLLPQFVPDGASVFWTSMLFAVIHAAEASSGWPSSSARPGPHAAPSPVPRSSAACSSSPARPSWPSASAWPSTTEHTKRAAPLRSGPF